MWPFRKRIETRTSWADAVSRLEHILSSSSYDDVKQTAAATIAGGILERAFLSARVDGASQSVLSALNKNVLSFIGRHLMIDADVCIAIIVENGDLKLYPATAWNIVSSSPDPDEWVYNSVHVPTPSGQRTFELSGLDVIHIRYNVSSSTPWAGRSPLRSGNNIGAAHNRIESSLSKELKGVAGRLLPAPMDPANVDAPNDLMEILAKLEGGPLMVESMSGGHGNLLRSDTMQKSDWEQKRIGPDPPQALIQLRDQLQTSAALCLGIPAELVRSDASSSARREAWRVCYHGTIQPLARLVENELRHKLESPDLTIHLDDLGASDVQGRARSLGNLVTAGIDLPDAQRLANLQ